MIKQWVTSYRVSVVLAFISILVALLGLPTTLAILVAPSNQVLFAASLVLLILAETIRVKVEQSNWTGFVRLPLLVIWLVLGIESSVALVVLGSSIAIIIRARFEASKDNYQPLGEGLKYIANSGISILAAHMVYIFLGGSFPILQEQSPYYDIPIIIIALLAGSAMSLLIYLVFSPEAKNTFAKLMSRNTPSEILILMVALVLPLIFNNLGALPFLSIVALVAGQNIRQIQVARTRAELKMRILEVATLSSFGNAVTAQISLPSVLELVYRELKHVIDATTFFIALYDDDQDTLEYPFVMQDDERVIWQKHKLDQGLVDFVIRQKHSMIINKQAKKTLPKAIDSQQLKDAHYIIVPLIVGLKTIGAVGMSRASILQAFSATDFELLETIGSQTSLAIRNAHLYDRTVRLADNLSVINQSLQDVMFNLDRNDALRTACQIALNVTRAQKAAIFLLQPTHDYQMMRVESIGFEELDFSEYITYKPDIFQNGARKIVDVAETSFLDIQEQAKLGNFQACLQVPLRSGGTVIGNLTVYHDEAYYYETPELNLLEMLANQITAALDNADLLQALELYAAEQAQLVHLSRISGVSLDLERIIRDVCEMLAQMMDMRAIAIAMYQSDRDVLRLESPNDGFGLRMQELSIADIPEMKSLLDPNAITSLSAFYANQGLHSKGLQQFLRDNEYGTVALLPMRINQDSIGLIMLADYEHRDFSENDYRLLEMATHQITAQVHNARLHTSTQEALVQRLEQLDLIEGISRQISQSLDFDVIIQNVLEAALQSTHADFAVFALLNENEYSTFELIGSEVVGDKLLPFAFALETKMGVIGYVANKGEMLLVSDNQDFPEYVVPEGTHNAFRSSLAIPLLKGDKVIGVLNLESKQPNFFTLEQASFLKSLADHAVISIDNADLLKQREQQINILTHLREMALHSLNVISPDKIAQSVLHTALVIFGGQESLLYRYNATDKSLSQIFGMMRGIDGKIEPAHPIFPESVALASATDVQVKMIADIEGDELYQGFEQKGVNPHRSLIAIPIIRRNQVQEILCISFAETRKLSKEDIITIDLLAVQAAGHLENAVLNETITTSNERMRVILDSTRDGVVLLDSDGLVQDTNNAAEVLMGLPLRHNLGKPLATIIQAKGEQGEQDDVLSQIIQAYIELPENIHERSHTLERGESYLHMKTFVYSVQDDAGHIVGRLLVLRDITKQKDLQDFHDRMQGMVLHDLRGPLSSIITSMYMTLDAIAHPGDESQEEFLLSMAQISLDSGNDLLELVDTLQELPRMAEMQPDPNKVDLYDLAHKARKALAGIMEEGHITVDIDIPKDEVVFADSSLIRRVFVNLLHNAVKFTPENGRILIRSDYEAAQDGYLRVQIADTGPGIPEEERERIFGEGVQIAGRKSRTGGKGMGIGLNFCKLATEGHGGHIWVEQESPLLGACFAFTLPITNDALNAALSKKK